MKYSGCLGRSSVCKILNISGWISLWNAQQMEQIIEMGSQHDALQAWWREGVKEEKSRPVVTSC